LVRRERGAPVRREVEEAAQDEELLLVRPQPLEQPPRVLRGACALRLRRRLRRRSRAGGLGGGGVGRRGRGRVGEGWRVPVVGEFGVGRVGVRALVIVAGGGGGRSGEGVVVVGLGHG